MSTNLSLLSLLMNFVFVLAVAAQDVSPYQPRLQNSKSGDVHDFPLGVLSATGRLEDGDRAILVVDVGDRGAASRGGLMVGDRIVLIRGQQPHAYSKSTDSGLDGPQTELAIALEQACAEPPHRLQLSVERNEESLQLSVDVPPSSAFAESFPGRCPKSEKYLASIADHLAATQQQNGSWRPGVGGDADVYAGAFCALALLVANNEAHLPSIQRAIDFIKQKSISTIDPADPKVGPKNWQAASSAILLAEYQLATGDDAYFADLKKCCDLLALRVSENGTMGHHVQIPYGGGGLVIVNVQAHLGWALAEKCGYDVNAAAWARSFEEVRKSIHQPTGAVGYSSRATWSPDIAARTGAMAAALAIREQEPELVAQFRDALVAHQGRMRHAHAMSSIGLIYGFAGLKLADPESHKLVLQKWKPYLELCRTSSGSAAYFGGKRNIGGDQYLGLPAIGNATVALVLASGQEKLFLHGGKQQDWFGATDR
ncbi:MAG: hypothetical protein KDA42_04435 [Planctomycetales bacterium]|nr:hypothetical protein [Planctomycetales bacterium]